MKETSAKMIGAAHRWYIPHVPLVSVKGCHENIPWTWRADSSEFGKELTGITLCCKTFVGLV